MVLTQTYSAIFLEELYGTFYSIVWYILQHLRVKLPVSLVNKN